MKWVQLYGNLNILWYCLSLGLEWKLTFPVTKEIIKSLLLWNEDDRCQFERIVELSSRLESGAIGYRQEPSKMKKAVTAWGQGINNLWGFFFCCCLFILLKKTGMCWKFGNYQEAKIKADNQENVGLHGLYGRSSQLPGSNTWWSEVKLI